MIRCKNGLFVTGLVYFKDAYLVMRFPFVSSLFGKIILRIWFLCFLLLFFYGTVAVAYAAATQQKQAVILSSRNSAPYKELIKGFRDYFTGNGRELQISEYGLDGDTVLPQDIVAKIGKNNIQAILSLGEAATKAAISSHSNIPIVACMVLNSNVISKARNATGVVLEFPVKEQFDWLRRFLPEARTVGVIYNPAENRDKIKEAGKIAKQMGLALAAREVNTPKDLPGALDSLANSADVLWGISDRVVLTPQTAKNVLLFSFRNRIPFIGLSAAWVKAGAFYSLDRDFEDMGEQCGEMIGRVLFAGDDIEAIDPETPRDVTYSLNRKAIKRMKVSVPETMMQKAGKIY